MKPSVSVNKKIYTILWLSELMLSYLFLFFYGSFSAMAQTPQNKLQIFEQAQSDYRNGKVYKVLQLEKYATDLPSYLQDDAYYLLFQSYVQTQQDSMALVTMRKLLKESPTLDPKKENEKFRYFYQKFASKPREVGLMIGQNYHRANIDASRTNRGLTLGLVHNQYLNRKILLYKNLIYSERHHNLRGRTGKYNIPGTFIGQTNIDASLAEQYKVKPEKYPTDIYHLSGDTYPSFIELASGLQWNILSLNKFQLFVKGGLAANFLIETTFDIGDVYYFQIEYTDEDGRLKGTPTLESPVSLEDAQDAEHNTLFNFNLMGATGIRYKIQDGILFLEARWQQSVVPQEISFSSEVGDFEEIINTFEPRTLEFQTSTLTFSFGYLFSIHHFKKLRRK